MQHSWASQSNAANSISSDSWGKKIEAAWHIRLFEHVVHCIPPEEINAIINNARQQDQLSGREQDEEVDDGNMDVSIDETKYSRMDQVNFEKESL